MPWPYSGLVYLVQKYVFQTPKSDCQMAKIPSTKQKEECLFISILCVISSIYVPPVNFSGALYIQEQ